MRKRTVSFLLAALMLLALVPVSVFAASRANAPIKERTVVVSWDFETDPVANGWQLIDSDGDGHNWAWVEDIKYSDEYFAVSGTHSLRSCSFEDIALNPDNWAVSPAITVPSGRTSVTYQVCSYSSNYQDVYSVYIGTSPDINSMTVLTAETLTPVGSNNFEEREVDISAYAGQTVYVAFRHHNCFNHWRFYIDDVVVLTEGSPESHIINTIEVEGFTAPAWGEAPDRELTVPQDAHYAIGYAEWFYHAAGMEAEIMTDDQLFDNPEYVYYMGIEIYPEAGYTFDDTVSFIVNGDDSIIETSGLSDGNSGALYYWGYTVNYNVNSPIISTPIDTVELTGFTAPAWGEAPDYELNIPENANYTINRVEWNWIADPDNTGILAEGELFNNENYEYYMYCELAPASGYVFAGDVTVRINGSTEIIARKGPADSGNNYWICTINYSVADVDPYLITELHLNGVEFPPVSSWLPAEHLNITIPDGEHYTISSTRWFDEVNYDTVTSGFVAGGQYSVNINLAAEDGYTFADDITIYINGETGLTSNYVYNYVTEFSCYTIAFECISAHGDIGDVNGDGEINVYDALFVMRCAMGIETIPEGKFELCDVDMSGIVDTNDALIIMRYIMGLIEQIGPKN